MRRSGLILQSALLAAACVASQALAAAAALPSRTSDERMVKVTVTPRELGCSAWEFDVVLSTHAQELTDDLVKSSVLTGGAGQQHVPREWRGDAPGGHHRKGTLVFEPVQPRPGAIELRIQRPGEPSPRIFSWQVK